MWLWEFAYSALVRSDIVDKETYLYSDNMVILAVYHSIFGLKLNKEHDFKYIFNFKLFMQYMSLILFFCCSFVVFFHSNNSLGWLCLDNLKQGYNIVQSNQMCLYFFCVLCCTVQCKSVYVCYMYIFCSILVLQSLPESAICFLMVSSHSLRSAFHHSSAPIWATSVISSDIHLVAALLKLQKWSSYFQRWTLTHQNSATSKSWILMSSCVYEFFGM